MRPSRLTSFLLLWTAAAVVGSASLSSAANIEAVKGKRYMLTREHAAWAVKHGKAWMIMVATFNAPPPERRAEGLTPQEAADELVWELRKKGIPAYTFAQEDVVDTVDTTDRLMRQRSAMYVAQRGSVCVLAGNYESAEDEVAQKTLDYIKRFHPEFLRQEDPAVRNVQGQSPIKKLVNGGILRLTPGQPGPLGGAFLTINPLITPEEAQRSRKDPLLVKLNSGNEFSLANNPGRYTVVVATFTGKSLTTTANGDFQNLAAKFDVETGNSLDGAAEDAWKMTQLLRRHNREAWVWHDRYHSIVTVGSFDNPNDPRIREVAQFYGAKRMRDKEGKEYLHIEYADIPDPASTPKNPKPPLEAWPFDPAPKLMEVPRLH